MRTATARLEEQAVRQAREVARHTSYPSVAKLLSQFQDRCPDCGSRMEDWEFDFSQGPPIREHDGYDIVKYACTICGAPFRKIEVTSDDA